MTSKAINNRATLTRWYDEMWGRCDPGPLPELVADTYLRHDITGANNRVTAKQYQAIVTMGVGGERVMDFAYMIWVEGDFAATLGRYVLKAERQWDWVQLFRLEDGRLAETWLPGMGGNEPLGVPRTDNAWTDNTIPEQACGVKTTSKHLVQSWYESLAEGSDAKACLAPSVRWHDMLDADIYLDAGKLQERMRLLMQDDKASDLQLFLMENNGFVVATGMWKLGEDHRSWNWVQLFRIDNNQIAEGWITTIGGTDSSIAHTPQLPWRFNVMPEGATRFGESV